MTTSWLALDVGGANLKLADGCGYAASYPFPLWKSPEQLTARLQAAIADAPTSQNFALTMTGELADCFSSKREGVEFIMRSVRESVDERRTHVYLHDGRLVDWEFAIANPELASASNWHALACFSARFARTGFALLLDVGSTTVDLVPIVDSNVNPLGCTDTQRLLAGELVYTGVERSPVCALVRSLPYRGAECSVAQEVFATTRDVYLLLGELPEDAADHDTADQRPATCADACRRLGRMLCADDGKFAREDALLCARQVAQAQTRLLAGAFDQLVHRVGRTPETIVLSGHGGFLAQRMFQAVSWSGRLVNLSDELGPIVSRCAPAHALAVLARGEEEF